MIEDNNDKVYIFGGFFDPTSYYSNDLDIFDTMNRIWTNVDTGLVGRDGHTTRLHFYLILEIVYIGGTFGHNSLIDMNNVRMFMILIIIFRVIGYVIIYCYS